VDPTDLKIFAIDFEGNGREGILEFGAICLHGGELSNPVDGFCACPRETGIFLSRRKIPLERTASGVPFDNFLPIFQDMRRQGILAAHHAATEDTLLRSRCPSPGFVPDWTDPDRSLVSWRPWLDSRMAVKKVWPRLNSYGLRETLRWANLEGRWRELGKRFCPPDRCRPHCALYDAVGCALLLDCCLRKLEIGPLDLLRLLTGELQLRLAGIL
jgi:DNA polymerase III epsilon subunit-like protein